MSAAAAIISSPPSPVQDTEDMRGELAAWRAEAVKRSEALEAELRDSREVLAPQRRALAEAGERCKEHARRIIAARAAVARNDARIADLLRMSSTASASATTRVA